MKYFFVAEKGGDTHIVTAKSRESAKVLTADLEVAYLYELLEDTFEDEGFLMSDTKKPKREDYLEILDKQLRLLIEEQDKCENTKEKIKHTERICEHIYRLMCAIPESCQDEF